MAQLPKLLAVVFVTEQLPLFLKVPVCQEIKAHRTLKASVVPGVLKNLHVKGVLNPPATARARALRHIFSFVHVLSGLIEFYLFKLTWSREV